MASIGSRNCIEKSALVWSAPIPQSEIFFSLATLVSMAADSLSRLLPSRFAAVSEAIDALDGTLEKSDDVQAVFANDGDEAVRLFWKGPDGDVEVGRAAPGAAVEISTYRNHEFAAKLERHDEAFATYRIGAARRQTFRVRDPETQDL